MQIHNLNDFIGALGANAYVAVDNGEDTGKLAYSDFFAENSFTTLWTGTAINTNDEITLSKPLDSFDFLDIYYKVSNGGIKSTRIPTSDFPNSFVLEGSAHLAVGGSQPFFYNFLSTISKTSASKLTITAASEYVVEGSSNLTAEIVSVPGITITRIDGITTPGNSKGVIEVASVSLPTAGWTNGAQTVTVDNVTANNSVLVSAAPSSQADFMTYGVNCTGQGDSELTFTCASTPASDLTAYVMVVG